MGVSIPLLHSDPEVWSHPERFDPGRWLGMRYSSHEYAPFGGGHRRCVGFALAQYEMRIVVATILDHAELALRPRDIRRRPPLSVPRNIATSPARAIPFMIRALR
jgi:cytochrome P450 family 110